MSSHRSPKAVTILELIIAMAVIGILLSVGLNGITKGQKNAEFKEAVNSTVDFIQRARSHALSSLELTIGGVPYVADAYYLVIGDRTIELYADLQGTSDELLEAATFSDNVMITKIPAELTKIIYTAPLGELEFEFSSGSATSIQLNLETLDGAFDRNISLSQIGRIPEVTN